MTNRKTTGALVSSVIALVLCCAMLVGSTFAWFTDSASTAVNEIKAGNLKVELQMFNGTQWVDAEGETLKFTENYWEPGCTYVLPALKVINKGDLALQYELRINGAKGDVELLDVLEIKVNGQLVTSFKGTLLTKNAESDEIVISVHMKEEAGNEYQNKTLSGLGITVYATQYTYEKDSIDDQYDVNAEYLAEVTTAAELANALSAGKNVKLLNDISVTETLTVPEGVAVELDLNGKTITGTEGRDAANNRIHVIVNNGILTIKDGTVKSAGNDGGSAIYNNEGATLTIEDVTLYGAPQSDPVYEAGVSKPFPSYAVNNYGNAVVNGATVKSYHGAIATGDNGVTVINDADIDVGLGQSTGITSYAIYSYGDAQVTVNGGKFAFTKQEIYVNGGNTFCELGTYPIIINGGNYIGTSFSTGAGREYVIKGGTFDADPSAHVADGYMVTETDGTYVVSVDKDNVCTADSFADALAEGGNVKVTANIVVDDVVVIPEGKEVVLDLNGNTLSKNVDSGIVVRNYGKLTLSGNGTIDGTIGNYAIRTEPGSELTINEGIVVDGGFGAVSCFGGKLTINGGDFSNEESNTTHYVVYATNNSTVVINGGTFAFGEDQYAGANGSPILASTNGSTIEINGGTFEATGGSALCYNANNIVIKGGIFKNRATATYGGTIEGKVAEGYSITKDGSVWTVAAE